MGGGRRYHYPKWVWSPAGGWWASPANWKRNTAIYFGVSAVIISAGWLYSEQNTVSVDIDQHCGLIRVSMIPFCIMSTVQEFVILGLREK
jgi:hypothetical protein